MAKTSASPALTAGNMISEINSGQFAPVYLLMGEEPYYIDKVCDAIMEHALTEDERDFNQLVCYGADTQVEDVISNARRYPMFAERQLVVVREAQALSGIENLAIYTDNPLDSTVLVLIYRGSLDKRKALYKSISKKGKVLESNPLRDYEMSRWILDYYKSLGLELEPDAAALLGECLGTDLKRIEVETSKLLKNMPEGSTRISVRDIELNVGVSREFSMFELTRQLSYRQTQKALRTAAYLSSAAKFAMPAATAALFNHFYRILKYHSLKMKNPRPLASEMASLLGVNPYFMKEYDAAASNYPLPQCMKAISLIREYDFKGKGGDSGEASASQLMMELTTELLCL